MRKQQVRVRGSDRSCHRLDAHEFRVKDRQIPPNLQSPAQSPVLTTWHLDGWKEGLRKEVPESNRRDSALLVTMRYKEMLIL